jgi:hypothetical protein
MTLHQLQFNDDGPDWCKDCGTFSSYIDPDYPCPSPGSNRFDTRVEENYVRIFESLFWEGGRRMSTTAPTTNPNIAMDFESLRTPYQLGEIRTLANAKRVCPWDECERVMGCELESLSKQAASRLIDYLKNGDFR